MYFCFTKKNEIEETKRITWRFGGLTDALGSLRGNDVNSFGCKKNNVNNENPNIKLINKNNK